MIPHLAEGDTVDITIRGARVFALPDPEDDPGERYWTFQLADRPKPPLFSVPLDFSEVTVEHAGPEGWPPAPMDLWADKDGDHWVALPLKHGEPKVEFLLDGGLAGVAPDDFLRDFGPLRLVHRRESAGQRLFVDLPRLEFPAETWGSSAAEVKP